MTKNEIATRIFNDIVKLIDFKNYHGITINNLNKHLIEIQKVNVDLDDNLNGESEYWLCIAEYVNDVNSGYLIGINDTDGRYGVIEWNEIEKKYVLVIYASGLADALNGM